MSEHRPRTAAIVAVALTGLVIVVMDWVPTPLNRNIEFVDAAQRLPGTLIHGRAVVQHTLIHALLAASAVLSAWVGFRTRRADGRVTSGAGAPELAR